MTSCEVEDALSNWMDANAFVSWVVTPEWFEQALVETVMGVQSLKGSPEWDFSDFKTAWGEEALSAAEMPRYHTDVAIKRSLGAKLGTLKQSSAVTNS